MKIIEHKRLVVEFGSFVKEFESEKFDFYPIANETVVLISLDENVDSKVNQYNCVSAFDWWYSAIYRICADRACLVETGDILPNGIKMKAEKYIGLWRDAKEKQISFKEMLVMGLVVVVTIAKPTAFLQDEKINEEYPELAALRNSPFIIKKDENEVVWQIKITDIDSLLAYRDLKKCWVDTEKFPVVVAPLTYAVEEILVANGNLPDAKEITSNTVGQFDLFGVAA